ncbi:unnamed protein product [Orchesella dallaii]|uniref:Uncharacterized protein n=1 Tax=Orchesella dallaii TaxID=48710 RepID=A0ABP1R058_9HEXA
MAHFTGYLLGKVQLDGAIRSEVLASLVETLIQRYQPTDPARKLVKFNENHRYSIECSERGLKLTSPGGKSKDEGFESDNESVRSVKISDSVELDIADLMDHLEIAAKEDKQTENVPPLHSSLSSSGGSIDNTSISSSSGLHVSDDSNSSSSGNGSDSDEFCNSGESSPFWETLPNLSCFQSYPIEDVVFCHCDSQHPSTLVWVVRHLAKMMALVTAFRTRSEAEDLFQAYRDLRLKLKPIRYGKFNHQGTLSKMPYGMSSGSSSNPSTPHPSSSSAMSYGEMSSLSDSAAAFCSLPPVYPTEILHETQSKSPLFTVHDTASLDFDFESSAYNCNSSSAEHNNSSGGSSIHNNNGSSGSHPSTMKEPLGRTGSNSLSLHQHIYVSNPNIIRHEEGSSDDDDDGTEIDRNEYDEFRNTKHNHSSSVSHIQVITQEVEESVSTEHFKPIPPEKPQRKVYMSKASGGTISSMSNKLSLSSSSLPQMVSKSILSSQQPLNSSTTSSSSALNTSSSSNSKPVLLVPLKTESVSSPRSNYPKESYLYHVMGRSSSTFAPYQRSLNFMPYQYPPGGSSSSVPGDYYAWGKGRHLLVPFSSWLELSEMPQIPHAVSNGSSSNTSPRHAAVKSSRHSSRNSQRLAAAVAAASNNPKGTSKILLRDLSARDHGVWASLSQRFKKNFRENLIPKLNGMWSQQGADGSRGNKKRTNKKVTFNAWATVQMV